ncbi:AAA family ATPase [Sulfurimonas indica]|uniref:AAA family ATPase n=1 Tax=Sulfurimonas indica TaxID=2508707 RepID=UPI001264FE14|nr:AAA family ATPase [Sulfurimonas indica]
MTDFRQFEARNQIDFSNIDDKHVSVVIASNGVGKTTILTALVWCLYGGKKLPYGDLTEQFLNNNTFDNLEEGEQATAEVVLMFEDRKSKYIVTRSIVVTKEGSKQVNGPISLDVVIDNVTQHYAQEKIDTILGPSMKEYFFFDGEGIGKLADSSRPDLVQKGIKNVMKIDTRTTAYDLIKEAKKTFDKESAKIQTNSGITDIPEERIDQIDDQLVVKKSNLSKAIEDRDIYEKKLLAIDKELMQIKETKPKIEERKRFEEELKSVESELINAHNKQKDLVTKNAYLALSHEAFSNVSNIIEDKQKRGELPLIGIGKHFIEELMKEHRCICGEELIEGGSRYKHLENIMKRATAKSELEGNLSSLGSFVESHKNDNKDFISRLKDSRHAIKELEKKKSRLEQEITRITDEIDKWLDYDKEERLDLKRTETLNEKDEKIKLIAQLEIEIEQLNTEMKKAKKDLEVSQSISEEVSLLRNRISFCEEAMSMLEEKNKEEIESIRIELSERLANRFEAMLHSEKKAYLDESFRLVVVGKDGNVSGKSRGEAKLISLIFISTLIELAKEKEMSMENDYLSTGAGVYPIIVDSPYGEFDAVYKKTISTALKELSPQVIILLNQEQWNEDIESVFHDSLAHAYRLIAHRPKLNYLEGERNRVYFNKTTYDLEVQDDREFTTIEKLEIK